MVYNIILELLENKTPTDTAKLIMSYLYKECDCCFVKCEAHKLIEAKYSQFICLDCIFEKKLFVKCLICKEYFDTNENDKCYICSISDCKKFRRCIECEVNLSTLEQYLEQLF